jgi:hypothetical protein
MPTRIVISLSGLVDDVACAFHQPLLACCCRKDGIRGLARLHLRADAQFSRSHTAMSISFTFHVIDSRCVP